MWGVEVPVPLRKKQNGVSTLLSFSFLLPSTLTDTYTPARLSLSSPTKRVLFTHPSIHTYIHRFRLRCSLLRLLLFVSLFVCLFSFFRYQAEEGAPYARKRTTHLFRGVQRTPASLTCWSVWLNCAMRSTTQTAGKEKAQKTVPSSQPVRKSKECSTSPSTTSRTENPAGGRATGPNGSASRAPAAPQKRNSSTKAKGGALSSPTHIGRRAAAPAATGSYPRSGVLRGSRSTTDASKRGSNNTPRPSHQDPEKQNESLCSSGFLNSPSRDPNNRNAERDEDLDDKGIVASSRLALARMSFENCVLAAAHLQDLMMAHAAAVTSAQQGGGGGVHQVAVAPRTLIDQGPLNTRPLHEIADELASQLQQLAEAYSNSSRAERHLMGVPTVESGADPTECEGAMMRRRMQAPRDGGAAVGDRSSVPQVFYPADRAGSGLVNHNAPRVMVREIGISPGETFGPMTNTQLVSSADPLNWNENANPLSAEENYLAADASRGYAYGDVDGGSLSRSSNWMIDVGQANPGPRLAAQRNRFVYPDGTCVSFPVSTFGELVDTLPLQPAAVGHVDPTAWADPFDVTKEEAAAAAAAEEEERKRTSQSPAEKADVRADRTPSSKSHQLPTAPKRTSAERVSKENRNGAVNERLNDYVNNQVVQLDNRQQLRARAKPAR